MPCPLKKKITHLITSLGIRRISLVSFHLKKRSSLQFDVLHFDVGDGRFESAGPITKSVGTVKQAGLVELVESLYNGFAAHFIHGEALAGPVHAATEGSKLSGNPPSIVRLPLPNFLHKLLSSKIMTVLAGLLHEHFLHHGLRCNASVIRSWFVAGSVSRRKLRTVMVR